MKRSIGFGVGAAVLSGVMALSGCSSELAEPSDKPEQDETKGAAGGKFEAWGAQDAPGLFSSTLEYKLDALPMNGQATNIPWASSYWPVYQDSINYKWAGATSDSASKKYEKAFGGTGVEDAVSRYHGIDAQTSRKECTATSECADLKDGSECAKRPGAAKGRCIPTWWGICHAWTPASILLPEAKNPVTKNGVTFTVNDIKALVTLVHNSTNTKFVSLRCNKDVQDHLPDSSKVHFDEYGRPKDVDRECRDTNAGTYHVLLANYLGIMKQAFAEDRTAFSEVWNQPLRAYRITQKKEVTGTEANRLVGVTAVGGTTVSKTGTVAKDVWSHQGSFPVAANSAVKVVMTGTGDADLHVAFGAQPTDTSYACRPYDSGSAETCDLVAPADATQVFVSVKGYAATSNFTLGITTGGSAPTTYVFNNAATKFFHIKAEVDYIGESSSSTDGNLSSTIDRYTHTDSYEYVLEVDASGKVVGGEWIGSSKTAHPDFLWLPLSVQGTSVAGGKITYAQVKALLDESIGSVVPPVTGSEKTVTETGTVAKTAWTQYGPYNLAAGKTLTATMTGDGDADLYVRKGSAPAVNGYDCRPYQGGSAESCSIVGPAVVYVGVNGYATTSNFSLVVKYTEGSGTVTPPTPPTTFVHLNETGSVALGELKNYQVAIPAGKKVVIRTTSAVDIDLYIQMNAAPSTSAYLARGYTSSGAETITYTATESGTLNISVHGYKAGAFTLKTADN